MDGMIVGSEHKGRLWLCKKTEGHILGLIVVTQHEGHCIDRLLLLREATDFSKPDEGKPVYLPADIKVMGFPEGTMHEIECSICQEKRTWWIGQGAAERFIEARKKRVK